MHPVFRLLRWFGCAALVLYFVVGITWLGLRYVVLPQVDQWRAPIAQQLSQSLGASVRLGAISVQWRGVNPQITLRDVTIDDSTHGGHLHLPYLTAIPSWRSFIHGQVQFARLEVAGLNMTVRRDAQGALWILGQSVDQDSPNDATLAQAQVSPALAWLMAQPHIDFADITLRWIDELRQAPPLVLDHAKVQVHHSQNGYAVAVQASPPAALATTLDLRAELHIAALAIGQPLALTGVQGKVYTRMDAMQPSAWRPWLDIPPQWKAGLVWAQTSMLLKDGHPQQVALDVRIQEGRWQWSEKNQLRLADAQLYAEGAWQALAWTGYAASQDRADALRFRLQATQVRGQFPTIFDQALQWNTLTVAGRTSTRADGHPQVHFDQVSATNADMDIAFQGNWYAQAGIEAGVADVQGRFARLKLDALARYLPKLVNADARQWMRIGLLGGTLQQATWAVRGELAHFPFGDAPNKGDYTLQGRVQNAVIDYAPETSDALSWPRLDAIEGQLHMRRVALTLQADRATMLPAPDLTPIVLTELKGHIPNIERNAELTVQGVGRAPAATYLGLMHHSPLGQRLDHVFEESSGTGQWEVPLTLVVPLLHSIDLTVQGEVRFHDGALQLMPEMPPFERLQGAVAFTHEGIYARALHGQFLGGALSVQGGIGEQQSGLQLTGEITAEALSDYVGLQGMQHLRGSTAVNATVQRHPHSGFELTLTSNLNGLALTLPAPLAKPAARSLPLRAHWGRVKNTQTREQMLQVEVGNTTLLRLVRRPDVDEKSYFQAGSFIVDRPAPSALPDGMYVDVRATQVDISAWNQVVQAFSQPLHPRPSKRPLLPDLRSLRVQAEHLQLYGLNMAQARLYATQEDAWHMTLDSPQTAGTLMWVEGGEAGHGLVQARFERLSIGRVSPEALPTRIAQEPNGARDAQSISDALNIPAIDLHARQFTLYGTPLGELSLTGVQHITRKEWLLESVRLLGSGLDAQGSGVWQLRGAQRGLRLDLQANVTDLGAYLAQARFQDVLVGGRGALQGTLFWHDLPWQTGLENLQGTFNLNLEKGRFSRVSSRLARLLELLSIQSITRLARLDWNLDALVHEGFPFDMLRGEIRVGDGKLTTQDYRVVGPVGTIVIGGNVDFLAQRQDLQAVVIPNLDMSGAALAAGIAANPIAGVGAFLAQWLLRVPLEKAMAVEYRVGGSWDHPDLKTVRTTVQGEDATHPEQDASHP